MNQPLIRQLIIYVRQDCHLCEDMVDDVRRWCGNKAFRLDIRDVDDSCETRRRYGTKVPVLLLDGVEICCYYLNPHALDAAL